MLTYAIATGELWWQHLIKLQTPGTNAQDSLQHPLRRDEHSTSMKNPSIRKQQKGPHRAAKLTRNQGLIAEFEAGKPMDQLMAKYDLSENRVRAILADERNRRIASALPFYREFRLRQES